MRYWIKYILLVCLIGIGAYQVATDSKTEDSCAQESSSHISDIREDYAQRLQQQLDWTDALVSSQIGIRTHESRLRTRRAHTISSAASRIYSNN